MLDNGWLITTHPESTFIEVKAVHGVVNLEYGRHQIRGMLHALSRTPAASSEGPRRAFPSLYLITTGDTLLGTDIEQLGTQLNVLVWRSLVVKTWSGQLQVAPPQCLNCFHVLHGAQTESTLFGLPFSLPAPGASGSSGLDAPILDDGLVGSPGTPGNTSPNP